MGRRALAVEAERILAVAGCCVVAPAPPFFVRQAQEVGDRRGPRAARGIRVNCICTGYIETPMTDALTSDPASYAALKARHPMGRLGNPEDIANAALFLASDESAFMTGAPLIVDGGYTAQ